MLSDSVVVVPNSKLAGNVITNFSLPQDEVAVTIDVGVTYQSDLEHVERVTLEVAREIAAMDGAVAASEPRLRFHTFADSAINFTLWVEARDFVSGMAVKHELIKRLHAQYRREGIDFPFPTRTIDVNPDTLTALREVFRNGAMPVSC
jgi:small-conductance mechanosensitive channel